MVNFSDGKSDGLVLMYAKGGKVYPLYVKLSELEMLDFIVTTAITKVTPIMDKCIGDLEVIK